MLKKTKSVVETVEKLIQDENLNYESDESINEPAVVTFDKEEYELPQAQSTDFRKANVKFLSEQSVRYKGVVASRKDLNTEEEDSESSSERDEHGSFTDSELSGIEEEEEENSPNSSRKNSDNGSEDHLDNCEYFEKNLKKKKANLVDEKNRNAEIQKGICVQNQLRIWELLLEMRIRTQSVLNKSNQLHTLRKLKSIENKTPLQIGSEDCVRKITTLLNSLLNLKHYLCDQFLEIKDLNLARKRFNELVSDGPPAKRFAEEIDGQFNNFQAYRNQVLLKWEDRTRLSSSRIGNKPKTLNEEFDIVQKIQNALLNRDALVERSQMVKSKDPTTVKEEDSEKSTSAQQFSDSNIYDDSDFYHQQLRELIEYKASTSSSLKEVTKQYADLQKLRKKMKKTVDTRASKGRKLRYVVHQKLINLMAPEDSGTWTEESKNELYQSLFMT